MAENVIILVSPEKSENVGAVCRAMKTMALSSLRIVGKVREDYNDEKVRVVSVHGIDIWKNALFYPTLEEACADCCLVAGITRRRGQKRKNRLIFPEEFAEIAGKHEGKVASVFGTERTGLTDDELALCNLAVEIPASKKDGSLNLSHAVQVICCALFRENSRLSPSWTAVEGKELREYSCRVCDYLEKVGFFRNGGRNDAEHFFADIAARGAMTEGEIKYFEKFFSKIAGIFERNKINT